MGYIYWFFINIIGDIIFINILIINIIIYLFIYYLNK